MDRPKALEQALDEALAVFETLRQLGFSADDIWFSRARAIETGKLSVFVMLETQGKKFNVNCGAIDPTPDELLVQRWKEKGAWWNTKSTAAERDALLKRSNVRQNSIAFLLALAVKGIHAGDQGGMAVLN